MIDIIVLNEDDLDVLCVYRIWFGHKYYIGSTQNSFERILGHEKSINEGFLWIDRGKNSIANIIRHIGDHPYINVGFFEVLQKCETRQEAYDVEQIHFNKCRNDKNCLNFLFDVRRSAIKCPKPSMTQAEMDEFGRKHNMIVYEQFKDQPIKPPQWPQLLSLLGFTEEDRPL